jgi:uncharacterized protein YjdB
LRFTRSIIGGGLLLACSLAGCTLSGLAGQTSISSQASPGSPQNGSSANKAVTNVMVSADSMVINAKKTQLVQATVTYADGTKDSNVSWSSSDSTIVAVNPTTGLISGVAPGVATIQAKATNNTALFANVTVTVKPGVVDDALATITPSAASLSVAGTIQLNAAIQNTAGQQTPNGSWASSNSTIAMVNGSGLVTGIKPGQTTITFTSDQNSTVYANATITVTGSASPSVTPTPTPSASATPTPTATSTN